MRKRINKIFSVALILIMMLNYVILVVPVKPKHHFTTECHCSENRGCGCKGKVTLSFTGSVCLDTLGCGCSKGKNIPDPPIKEGLISKIEVFSPLSPSDFLNNVKEPTNLITADDIFHPPENFA